MKQCIILHSCAKYHFILDEFFQHFEQHFLYEDYDIYHITERIPYYKHYTTNIVLKDESWRDRFVKALDQIQCETFLYLQEDMLILHTEPEVIAGAFRIYHDVKDQGCVIIKLGTFHDFTLNQTAFDLSGHPIFIQNNGPYVMSHQPPAIFNKEFFIKTLYKEHNVWTHECEVSEEINNGIYGNIFALCIGRPYYPVNKSDIITSHHAIRKGIYIKYDTKTTT